MTFPLVVATQGPRVTRQLPARPSGWCRALGQRPTLKALGLTPQADLSPLPSGRPCSPSQPWDGCVGPGQTGKSSRQPAPGALSQGSARAAGLPCVWMELLLPFCGGRGERQSPSAGHDPRKDVPRSLAPHVGGTWRPPSPGASCRHGQWPPRGRGRW